MQKTKPILFSTTMVKAILEGRKTQTRRVIKPQPGKDTNVSFMPNPPLDWCGKWFPYKWETEEGESISKRCPYGNIGDILWVRETWQYTDSSINIQPGYVYRATDPDWESMEVWKWKPSIFMPKSAARIFLKITDVKVERLQNISEEDAIKEGVKIDSEGYECWDYLKNFYGGFCFSPEQSFESLWQKINGTESWKSNPFVWVIEFKRIYPPSNILL